LSPTGVVVVWSDPQEPAGNRKLRQTLEAHGLTVEVGTNRDHACAVAAQRRDLAAFPKVA
jgi:hypothetical protein